MWRKSYGGYGSDTGNSIIRTNDGGYVIYGSTGSFGEGGDAYILKLTANGDHEWSRYHGGTGVENGSSIIEASDGSFFVSGTTNSTTANYSGYLERLDSEGGIEWTNVYESDGWEFFNSMDIYSSGLYIVGTSYSNSSNAKIYLSNVSNTGDTLWTRKYSGDYSSMGNHVRATSDGGCVITGSIQNAGGNHDVIVIKYDANGELEWDQIFGSDADDVGRSITISLDGGFVLTGYSTISAEHTKIYIARVEANGDFGWDRVLGDQIGIWEGRNIKTRSDGGYVVVGFSDAVGGGGKDAYLLLVDENGYYQSAFTYGFESDEVAYSMDHAHDDGYVFTGYTDTHGPGVRGVYVVKTLAVDSIPEPELVESFFDPVSVQSHIDPLFQLHPNPIKSGGTIHFSLKATRSITLTDLSGRIIIQASCNSCSTYQIPQVASGMYRIIFNLQDGGRSAQSIVVD